MSCACGGHSFGELRVESSFLACGIHGDDFEAIEFAVLAFPSLSAGVDEELVCVGVFFHPFIECGLRECRPFL